MGAWSHSYRLGLTAEEGTQLALAIKAVKCELVAVGFGHGIVVTTPLFGNYAEASAIEFQRSVGITADGVVGPVTARKLFNVRCRMLELDAGIPDRLLSRLKTSESSDDPNASNANPNGTYDRALLEINDGAHPTITLAQAVDPSWCLPWGAKMLKAKHERIPDWDAVLVSWNQGDTWALRWLQRGKPSTGGDPIDIAGRTYGRWEWATEYVRRIRAMPV